MRHRPSLAVVILCTEKAYYLRSHRAGHGRAACTILCALFEKFVTGCNVAARPPPEDRAATMSDISDDDDMHGSASPTPRPPGCVAAAVRRQPETAAGSAATNLFLAYPNIRRQTDAQEEAREPQPVGAEAAAVPEGPVGRPQGRHSVAPQ